MKRTLFILSPTMFASEHLHGHSQWTPCAYSTTHSLARSMCRRVSILSCLTVPRHLLQGHIWQEGFASGELTADLYDDVQPAMADWVSQGLKTYIYSSGSRQAQKNLFTYTQAGDLRGLLSGFFDTTSGLKVSFKVAHFTTHACIPCLQMYMTACPVYAADAVQMHVNQGLCNMHPVRHRISLCL